MSRDYKMTPVKKIQKGGTSVNRAVGQMIGYGIIAGMRATFAPAFLSHFLHNKHNGAVQHSKLNFIQSPVASAITKGLAVLEIVGDKSPATPNRTALPQVMARIASGSFAGAVVAKANNERLVKGVLIGGLAALAGTFAAFYLRRYIDKLPKVKDAYVGVAEDVLGLAAGSLIMK